MPPGDRLRRRTTVVVFIGVALATTGLFSALTVAAVVADELMGLQAWSGLPSAAGIAGTALGASGLGRVAARRGRRPGIVLGFAVAVGGALVAVAASVAEVFPAYLLGMLAVGWGNAAALMGRFAAADVHPGHRRTSVLGTIVWAGTLGGIAGPALVDPAADVVVHLGLPRLTGGFVVAALGFTLAAIVTTVWLRPDPSELATDDDATDAVDGGSGSARPVHVRVAIAALIAGQFVMVLIMTMTPVHLRHAGHELGVVSVVMSAHVFGMYALTPLAGRLADRFGHRLVIVAGLVLLATAGLTAAATPEERGTLVAVPLFLLGLGWSFGFVAASGLLTRGASFATRARVQGRADTLVFASASVASVSSGVLVSTVGYGVLCLLGAVAVLAPAAVVIRHRRTWVLEPAVS